MTRELRLDRYGVRPLQSFANRARAWTERHGVLLTIDLDGCCGLGEAAPLPGYSDDTLEATHQYLQHLSFTDVARLLELPLPALARALDGFVPRQLPSARFALETALLELQSKLRGVPLHRWLRRTEPSQAPLALSALIDAEVEPQAWAEHASSAEAAGFGSVKVKVGRPGRFSEELAGLAKLRAATSPAFGLRLDANGAFDPERCSTQLDALAALSPEFLEEPFPRGAAPPTAPPLPLALDESLRDLPELTAELAENQNVVACVLKPGPLGGVLRCLALAESARACGIASVVSHAFEGPVAFAASCELALALGATRLAHGLASHAALEPWSVRAASYADPAEPRLSVHSAPGLGLPELASAVALLRAR